MASKERKRRRELSSSVSQSLSRTHCACKVHTGGGKKGLVYNLKPGTKCLPPVTRSFVIRRETIEDNLLNELLKGRKKTCALSAVCVCTD